MAGGVAWILVYHGYKLLGSELFPLTVSLLAGTEQKILFEDEEILNENQQIGLTEDLHQALPTKLLSEKQIRTKSVHQLRTFALLWSHRTRMAKLFFAAMAGGLVHGCIDNRGEHFDYRYIESDGIHYPGM
eukprot:CAMPEP_0167769572 /NCGR_PEP_ID=MMETSP0110_2-20121227/17379_1 /TAXON_ID=629695 /ORGANISM="Gymnochlora sp., Strain CCMP2014" /LENGTH=130 /DNA_ID=CAMNT_0007658535 /DNA_START=169 /DNA_END=559 /DNA_ORIENTATION=+